MAVELVDAMVWAAYGLSDHVLITIRHRPFLEGGHDAQDAKQQTGCSFKVGGIARMYFSLSSKQAFLVPRPGRVNSLPAVWRAKGYLNEEGGVVRSVVRAVD